MVKAVSAYIAGFFDGDGSVRLQFQPRQNSKSGFRIRAVISFAQKVGHEKELKWIREQLGIGYLYTRNDGMSELKIEGLKQVKSILTNLLPYVHFKENQVRLVIKALNILEKNPRDIVKVAQIADRISGYNYVTVKRKYTAEYIKNHIKRYTPVTTDPSQIKLVR